MVEAVFEELAVKRQVIADVESAVGPTTVIATNTSTLAIHEISSVAHQRLTAQPTNSSTALLIGSRATSAPCSNPQSSTGCSPDAASRWRRFRRRS